MLKLLSILKFLDPVLWILLLKRVNNKKRVKQDNARFYTEVDRLYERNKRLGKSALFFPEFPKKKAALSTTLSSLGFALTNDPERPADFVISWEDTTVKKDLSSEYPVLQQSWNGACLDIGKTETDIAFEKVFGYGTRVDPKKHIGKMLEKSEINAMHEARVVAGPISKPREGYIYQMVLNNQVKYYFYEDVRVTYIKGEIPFCYLNFRLKGKRFSNKKYSAEIVETEDVITKEEIGLIDLFCKEMRVDYAEMDCIRNRDDGKLYIIDVNTTAFGPANGLRYDEKMKGLDLYQASLKKVLGIKKGQ